MYDWLATVQEKIGAITKQLLDEIQGTSPTPFQPPVPRPFSTWHHVVP